MSGEVPLALCRFLTSAPSVVRLTLLMVAERAFAQPGSALADICSPCKPSSFQPCELQTLCLIVVQLERTHLLHESITSPRLVANEHNYELQEAVMINHFTPKVIIAITSFTLRCLAHI